MTALPRDLSMTIDRPPDLDRGTLAQHLQDLAGWADDQAEPRLKELRSRLAARELRVLVVGEAKRGKSTLGNAILGRELLPTGVRPVTAITTTIQTGTPEHLEVSYLDGHHEEHRLEDVAAFVTEKENPGNTRKVASVRAVVERASLEPAVLVDTPGVGSVLAHNTDEASEAMESMDLAVFVLTADPPISLTERTLFERVRARAVATFVVLNKIDRLSPAEVEEASAFVKEVTDMDRIFTCSARAALDARVDHDPSGFRDSGVESLVDELTARIEGRADQDLVKSVAAGASRLAGAAIERIRLTRAALSAVIEDRRRDVDVFTQEVDRCADTLTQALASISWEARQTRRRLDTAAADDTNRTGLQLLDKLDEFTAHIASEHAERQARQAMVTLIERDVGAWRDTQLTAIQQSVSTLITRQQEYLDRVADDVSTAAHRHLGVDVRPVIERLSVPDIGGFHFDFSPAVGWNTPLTEGVRHHLPTRWRHKAIATHLRSEALTLVDRQYGRARSDLQDRLEAAHRELATEVTARVHEQRDALAAALRTATDLREDTTEQQLSYLVELDARIGALQALAKELAERASDSRANG